jgi:hypothetical protein
MKRLEVGDIVKTSYGTGPYEIMNIMRGCKCDSFDDEKQDDREHIHLRLRMVGDRDKGEYYLNRYDEETLQNLDRPEDRIIPIKTSQPIQATFDFA